MEVGRSLPPSAPLPRARAGPRPLPSSLRVDRQGKAVRRRSCVPSRVPSAVRMLRRRWAASHARRSSCRVAAQSGLQVDLVPVQTHDFRLPPAGGQRQQDREQQVFILRLATRLEQFGQFRFAQVADATACSENLRTRFIGLSSSHSNSLTAKDRADDSAAIARFTSAPDRSPPPRTFGVALSSSLCFLIVPTDRSDSSSCPIALAPVGEPRLHVAPALERGQGFRFVAVEQFGDRVAFRRAEVAVRLQVRFGLRGPCFRVSQPRRRSPTRVRGREVGS